MREPMITVLLPVYDAQESVRRAIDSILSQSYREIELLVINDGSQDRSLDIIRSCDDPRIRVIDLQKNGGLIAALNLGIKAARGEFIARQDADDESFPMRLESQCQVLLDEPNIVAVGAALRIVKKGNPSGEVWRYPTSAVGARWQALFKTPVAHSAVVYRRRQIVALGGYSDDFRYAEDYELWSRLGETGGIRSLEEALVKYDVGLGGISRAKAVEQRAVHCRIAKANMARLLNGDVDSSVVDTLAIGVDRDEVFQELSEYARAIECLVRLYQRFVLVEQDKYGEFSSQQVMTDLGERFRKLIRMLPYKMRLRGLRILRRIAPTKSVSRASMVRMLCQL